MRLRKATSRIPVRGSAQQAAVEQQRSIRLGVGIGRCLIERAIAATARGGLGHRLVKRLLASGSYSPVRNVLRLIERHHVSSPIGYQSFSHSRPAHR